MCILINKEFNWLFNHWKTYVFNYLRMTDGRGGFHRSYVLFIHWSRFHMHTNTTHIEMKWNILHLHLFVHLFYIIMCFGFIIFGEKKTEKQIITKIENNKMFDFYKRKSQKMFCFFFFFCIYFWNINAVGSTVSQSVIENSTEIDWNARSKLELSYSVV